VHASRRSSDLQRERPIRRALLAGKCPLDNDGGRLLDRCADAAIFNRHLLASCGAGSKSLSATWAFMNWQAGWLEIKTQRGFDQTFLRFFERVKVESGSACARALRTRRSIVIKDIMTGEQFSSCRDIVSCAGVRAVQSTQ
jgi:hypothetical protein